MVNIDDLIRTNKIFGGSLKSKNALDFAVSRANLEKNLFRKLAFITRSMTSEHAFWDGNKRTAITSILVELANVGIKCDKRKIVQTMISLAKSGEGDIQKIERSIRKCTRK